MLLVNQFSSIVDASPFSVAPIDDSDSTMYLRVGQRVSARELVSRFPQMASLKALVAERTGHAGWQRLRPPLESLPSAQVKELLASATAFAAAV